MNLRSLVHYDVVELADSPQIYRRGEDYYQRGKVFRFERTKDGIMAGVHGNYGDYTVEIVEEEDDLEFYCDCPYDGYVCKHIVAVLLVNLGGIQAAPPAEPKTVPVELPHALRQALGEMTREQLLELIVQMAGEDAGVRQALLTRIELGSEAIAAQPRNPQLVEHLKKRITQTLQSFADREEYEDDYDYYEGEEENEEDADHQAMHAILREAEILHPADRLEVYWHVVACTAEIYGAPLYLGSVSTEQIIARVAEGVVAMGPDHERRQSYLDRLLSLLDTGLAREKEVMEAVRQALDTLCTDSDDYHYLIRRMEAQALHLDYSDWIANWYLALGDEESYLQVRRANLHTEEQYLDLADYYRSHGNDEQYLAALEECVAKLGNRRKLDPYWGDYLVAAPPQEATRRLEDYYRQHRDDANLARILMRSAENAGVTLELYRKVREVASRLGTWEECQAALAGWAQQNVQVLAEIYLDEQEWETALHLADRDRCPEEVQIMIADAVQQHYPREALRIYQRWVQYYIDGKSRPHYQTAAGYAAKIRSVYRSVLHDEESWLNYIRALLARYPRRRALQDEFMDL